MYFWVLNICLAFGLCAFLVGVFIPRILLISFRKKIFDMPDERKIHTTVIPRLGGVLFMPVVFFSFILLLGINIVMGQMQIQAAVIEDMSALTFGCCSLMILYLLGIVDDMIGVRYREKFVGQILSAIFLIIGGVQIGSLNGVAYVWTMSPWISYPLTVLAVVFIINAINLIDGVDGLASGLSCVALLFYGIWFIVLQKYIYAILAFATFGTLAAFFYYNVFGGHKHNRKIFMGDTGSLTIGMILCFLGIQLHQFASDYDGILQNPMVLAFSPLIVPCFDVVRVYLHRVRNGKSPFMPDKNHIHHKLLAMGMNQRQVMLTLIATSIVITVLNILLSPIVNVSLLLLSDILIWILLNIWLSRRISRRSAQ
ncbi:MraY family glycosyltransferase [uncultured Alistipes sp.]|uniref:MraY family glycosyltransferase n=1 Tax=uncultured Alistipes sp. TaxID=538949 RepID=UPI00341FE69C